MKLDEGRERKKERRKIVTSESEIEFELNGSLTTLLTDHQTWISIHKHI